MNQLRTVPFLFTPAEAAPAAHGLFMALVNVVYQMHVDAANADKASRGYTFPISADQKRDAYRRSVLSVANSMDTPIRERLHEQVEELADQFFSTGRYAPTEQAGD